jgi:hypothetical protein
LVHWSVTLESGGTSGQYIEFRAEVQVGGIGAWVAIEGSNRRIEQVNARSTSTICDTFYIAVPEDRFRLARRNVSGTTGTTLQQWDLIVART